VALQVLIDPDEFDLEEVRLEIERGLRRSLCAAGGSDTDHGKHKHGARGAKEVGTG